MMHCNCIRTAGYCALANSALLGISPITSSYFAVVLGLPASLTWLPEPIYGLTRGPEGQSLTWPVSIDLGLYKHPKPCGPCIPQLSRLCFPVQFQYPANSMCQSLPTQLINPPAYPTLLGLCTSLPKSLQNQNYCMHPPGCEGN